MSKVSARVFVVISPLLARLFDVIIDHLLIYQLMYPVIYVCCCKVTNTTVTKKWRIRYYWALSKRGVSSIFSIASPFCFLKDSCHVFFQLYPNCSCVGVVWSERLHFLLACLGMIFSHSTDLKNICFPSTFKFTWMVGFIQLLCRPIPFSYHYCYLPSSIKFLF